MEQHTSSKICRRGCDYSTPGGSSWNHRKKLQPRSSNAILDHHATTSRSELKARNLWPEILWRIHPLEDTLPGIRFPLFSVESWLLTLVSPLQWFSGNIYSSTPLAVVTGGTTTVCIPPTNSSFSCLSLLQLTVLFFTVTSALEQCTIHLNSTSAGITFIALWYFHGVQLILHVKL